MPTYVTEEDLAAEIELTKKVVKFVSKGKGRPYFFAKLHEFHAADMVLRDKDNDKGAIHAYLECKARKCNHDTYPTYMISAAKIDQLRTLGRPVLLAIQYADCAKILWNINKEDYRRMNEIRDRDGPTDREDMCHFNISQFETINEAA